MDKLILWTSLSYFPLVLLVPLVLGMTIIPFVPFSMGHLINLVHTRQMTGYWVNPLGVGQNVKIGPHLALQINIVYATFVATGLPSGFGFAGGLSIGDFAVQVYTLLHALFSPHHFNLTNCYSLDRCEH